MRFKLQLEVNKRAFGNRLPINYQYEQSSAIYRILHVQIKIMLFGSMKMVFVWKMEKRLSFFLFSF